MDQVSLPYVNGQDLIFTSEGDVDVDINCPEELLRECTFTMHSVFNVGSGSDAHVWCNCGVPGEREMNQ